MKTEFDYGFEYAEENNGAEGFTGPVNINEMLTGRSEIPDGDYVEMKRAGIANPDSRKYWNGFNAFFN